jgi:hypothetical protein
MESTSSQTCSSKEDLIINRDQTVKKEDMVAHSTNGNAKTNKLKLHRRRNVKKRSKLANRLRRK